MPKYLLIQTCRECPFSDMKLRSDLSWGWYCKCQKLGRDVDPDSIDPECELEDYEEAGK